MFDVSTGLFVKSVNDSTWRLPILPNTLHAGTLLTTIADHLIRDDARVNFWWDQMLIPNLPRLNDAIEDFQWHLV